MKSCLVLLLGCIVLFSCEKDELPKPLTAGPSANTLQVSMGSDYADQLFFSLAEGEVVAQNNREIWDLAFSCGEDGRQIWLNTSKFMSMGATATEDLSSVNAQTSVTWLYDNAAGKEDSSAFYNWELNRVYVINRGNTTAGQAIGKVKFRVTAHTTTSYTIEWAPLTSQTIQTFVIEKNATHNSIFYSFTTGDVVSIEPPKDQWDLCFTSYTHVFHDGTPYLVTGVLTNRYVARAEIGWYTFDEIDYAYASSQTYSTDLNRIGYDWKYYDFDQGTYIVNPQKVYLLKSVENRYYKLRFLDFYDQQGNKGAPSFELQELVP